MRSPVRGRARRHLTLAALGLLVVAAALIMALPWFLSLPAAQRRMALEANRILAPSSLEFKSIRLSWSRPTEISGFVLKKPGGDRLVTTPTATFGWNLWQILVSRPKTVLLEIPEGDLDIERNADGTVDLYETLRPVISEYPPIRLKIRIDNGRMRYRDPMFSDPVVADQTRLMLDLGRNSEPIAWNIQLVQNQPGGQKARLEIIGDYSRAQVDAKGRHDLSLSLQGTQWPWTLANSVIQTRGELTGKLDGEMRLGRLRIAGDATVANLVAIGEMLSSDTVHLETVRARVNLESHDDRWTIDTLELTSPVASLTGEGTIPPKPGDNARLEATVDVAALAKQLPSSLHLRDDLRVEKGAARLRADITLNADGLTENWNVAGRISGLAARLGQKSLSLAEPATLAASLLRDKAATRLEQLDVRSSFLNATGTGDLDRGINLTATIDLAAFHERFRDWIDLGGTELAGQGKLDATYRRQGGAYRAGVNARFAGLRISGLPLVEKFERDDVTIDGTVAGPSTAPGWPLAWKDLSVRASSGEMSLKLSAQAGAAAGDLAVTGQAATSFLRDGRQHRVEAELAARAAGGSWTTERLAVALVRPSKWGPGIGPSDAVRWEGKGRYDLARDELTIESLATPPGAPAENETWITGDQKLRAAGLKSLGAAQIEVAASADMTSLGPWLAPGGPPWSGRLGALIHARRDGDLWNVESRVDVRDPNLAGDDGSTIGMTGDLAVTASATYAPRSDLLKLTELTAKAPNILVEGGGVIRKLTSRPELDLKGTLDLGWQAIRTLLARKVEPNARITGRPRGWRLAGTIDGVPAFDRMGSIEGELGVQIDSLDVFGMKLSGVPVVVRSASGRLSIDPIDGTLNGGVLHLEPELVRGKDGSTWLHLGPESSLDGAIVNDEVSHRVLSFAAPVLDGATRVQGKISLRLADAYLPLGAQNGAEPRIDGDMLFDDVRFMPGPLADQLLSVFQRERRPLAVLRDPIAVRIAGRKVYQRGLSIPVANLAAIGLDGSVDFDQNLDLVARFSLIPPRSGVPVLTPIMENAKFELPIRGTLKNPKIDGEALKDRWAGIGANLLGNSMEAGVNGLQRLLQGLPVPGLRDLIPRPRRLVAPPPPRPDTPGTDSDPSPAEGESPRTDHEVRRPAGNPDDRSPLLVTPAERQDVRQQRRAARLQKKAERRTARGPQQDR